MTSQERKQKSEELLSSMGITLVDMLPPLEEEDNVTLRTAEEIAERIIILTYLNCAASDQSLRNQMMIFLIHEGLWDKTSDYEKELFHKEVLTEDELAMMLWRTESIWLLLWVIRKFDSIHLPVEEASPNEIFPLLPGFLESTKDFIQSATRRTTSEILDQTDFILRLNWALRDHDGQLSDTLILNPIIAYERYFAISWVTQLRATWEESL